MCINRFSSAVLLVAVLCASQNSRSCVAGTGDTNEKVASSVNAEEALARRVEYEGRLAARDATDEGISLGQRGDFVAARKKFSEAIELDPGFSPAYRFRAAACLKKGDWAGALVDLDRLITLDSNDAEIFNERGYARRRLGDLKGAQDDFARCIALGTKLSLAYANRAEVEAMLGDGADAAADLAQARSLDHRMLPTSRASATPSTRERQAHATPRTGISNDEKGTAR